MLKLLHSQLETELEIYDKLIKQGRTDTIAKITLEKIESKITALQRVIYEQESRKINSQCGNSSSIICYVLQVVHRFGNYKNTGHYSIFRVPAKTVLQTQAGIR